jgi:hypothetical protein
MTRLGASFRTRVTRLRLLRRGGWGQFRAETVTLVDLDLEGEQGETQEFEVNDILEVNDVLDLDDEDAETGLYGRDRPN